ncbi:DUF1214 domain-containing protein [Sphingomonas sp. DT-204]|uniref:DUF1214 domain-containing protein n=1 Tax=Sphingomonas sp. DT-204 TaxID=3396166 RepID=UPI003F1BC032
MDDRTAGLKAASDGTLRVVLSATRPKDVPEANWLPVSADRFVLAIRSQGPDAQLLRAEWKPAPIRKVAPVAR